MADESVEDGDGKVNSIKPSQKRANVKKNRPVVCRFYAKSGGCKFEEKCRFVHINKGERPAVVESADCKLTTSTVHEQHTVCTQESQQQIHTEQTNEQIKENISKPSMRVTVAEKEPQNKLNVSTQDDQNSKTISKKLCRFFNTRGGCDRGDACKFYHEKPKTHRKLKKTSEEIESQEKTKENDIEASCVKHQANAKKATSTSEKLSLLDAEQLNNLRTRELEQLVRRFGKKRLTEVQDSSGTTYDINFTPSDPDWPFDIENILLNVTFPNDYPKKMFDAGLSQDQDLPLELTSVVNQGIIKWIRQQQQTRNKKDTVDLPFRSFLRWFDRNVEKLFIDAAKKMKEKEEHVVNEDQTSEIEECIENTEVKTKSEECFAASDAENVDPNPRKQRRQKQHDSYSHSSTDRKEILLSDFLTFKSKPSKPKVAANTKAGHHGNSTQNAKNEHIVFVDQESSDPVMGQPHERGAECNDIVSDEAIVVDGVSWGDAVTDDAQQNGNEKPRGTEIRFRGLELFENTSTLRTESIALTMECDKCKTKIDTKADKSRATAMRCARCTSVVGVSFRPSIVHQYSTSTLGYLDVQGWHPFDLIMADTCLIAGCLACSHETTVKGPQYGLNQFWCSKCHQKLQFQIESTRFFQLMPTSVLSDKCDVPLATPKKKAPGLRAGLPLPDNGTCKHYKKSYRWLRFPCCGKCYPCDVCHEEEECHEMKYATRMVCGFCSKEQPFSQGNCTACNSSITRAKTCHWEGGKGCRNKTMMSKGDDRKFKNTRKTVSRKSQAKATPGKSK